MSQTISARVLGVGDVPALRSVLAVFAEAFEDPATYASQPPSDSYLESLLASDTFVAIAGMAGETVVGGIAGYILPKFEQDRRECYIYDLAVASTHRRVGVASAMINALQRLAAERGIYVIFVQADYGDDPAVALYTKFGQREDVMHFDIQPSAEN